MKSQLHAYAIVMTYYIPELLESEFILTLTHIQPIIGLENISHSRYVIPCHCHINNYIRFFKEKGINSPFNLSGKVNYTLKLS